MDFVQISAPPAAPRPRLPEWLRGRPTGHLALHELKVELRRRGLHTVCESARCPNIHECFGRQAATFMILGNICTRRCGFCAVPQGVPGPLDSAEPARVAEMAARMNLRYVVITSVNRDDLPDGGSRHFAQTIREVRQALPAARIEILTPDFMGDPGGAATRPGRRAACVQSQHGNDRAAIPAGASPGGLSADAGGTRLRPPARSSHYAQVGVHGRPR